MFSYLRFMTQMQAFYAFMSRYFHVEWMQQIHLSILQTRFVEFYESELKFFYFVHDSAARLLNFHLVLKQWQIEICRQIFLFPRKETSSTEYYQSGKRENEN